MTRRSIILAAIAAPVARPETIDLTEIWNAFVAASKDWIRDIDATPKGGVDAAGAAAWQEVKNRWKKVERGFNAYYRG